MFIFCYQVMQKNYFIVYKLMYNKVEQKKREHH